MTNGDAQAETKWPTHVIRPGAHAPHLNGSDPKPDDHKDHVEPSLSPATAASQAGRREAAGRCPRAKRTDRDVGQHKRPWIGDKTVYEEERHSSPKPSRATAPWTTRALFLYTYRQQRHWRQGVA